MWKIIIFFRTDSPGDLQISLLKPENNDSTGGDNQGLPKVVTDLINITKSSPNKGTIKLSMTPAEDVRVGDSFEIKATLLASDGDMDQMFLVKVVDKEKKDSTHLTWTEFEGLMSFTMNHSQILHPYAEGEILERMYINMDSSVLLNHKKKLESQEQIELADKKYISSVYFHALFLYTISKKKKIKLTCDKKDMQLEEYIKEVFSTFYSEFLLNFGLNDLMNTIST